MKKTITKLLLLLPLIVQSQNIEIKEICNLDSMINELNPVSNRSYNTQKTPHKVLYQRSAMIAELNTFNKQKNIANFSLFKQALDEIFVASKESESFSSFEELLKKIPYDNQNSIDIGILNTDFEMLNYNEEDPDDLENGFIIQDNRLIPRRDKVLFIKNQATVISPLRDKIETNQITFNFKKEFWYSYADKKVKTLRVNLGDGVTRTVIQNGKITIPTVKINLKPDNKRVLKQEYYITYSNGEKLNTYSETLLENNADNLYRTFGIQSREKYLTSYYGFKGYNETRSSKGKLQYKTFFANGNYSRKIKKPVIIVDGFDPGDTRKIGNPSDTRKNTICKQMNYGNKNFITTLNQNGYDVIVVNFTYYRNRYGRLIDGGADYIERNALTLVSLIQNINRKLTQNRSREKLVVVGPSMGGLITRYALAYMEKKERQTSSSIWNHNTRLWVSIDSPHLGANIPLASQASIYFLGYKIGSAEAKRKYQTILNSTAAKQMLLQQFSYLYQKQNRISFFHRFQSNLRNNGVYRSNGFPKKSGLRKIAMTNGSINGETNGYSGQKVLDIRGFKKILWIKHKGFQMEQWFSKGYREKNVIFFGKTDKVFRKMSYTVRGNNFLRIGSTDAMPGGTANTQGDIKDEVIPEIRKKVSYVSTRAYKKNHAFIPTISSLAFNNKNTNWFQKLNRNLVCSRETPFDSYYGESKNTEHVSFNNKSISWLQKEINKSPQPPSFILKSSSNLVGPYVVCNRNTPVTFKFKTCTTPNRVRWQVSNNLQIISKNRNRIIVKPKYNSGKGSIKAITPNGIIDRFFQIGKPIVRVGSIRPFRGNSRLVTLRTYGIIIPSSLPSNSRSIRGNASAYRVYIRGNWGYIVHNYSRSYARFRIPITSRCGSTSYLTFSVPPSSRYRNNSKLQSDFLTEKDGCKNGYKFNIDKNYVNYKINIKKCKTESYENSFFDEESFATTIINKEGRIILETKNKEFSLIDYPNGIYFINITKNNKVVYRNKILKK